jgi:hypothetical protein
MSVFSVKKERLPFAVLSTIVTSCIGIIILMYGNIDLPLKVFNLSVLFGTVWGFLLQFGLDIYEKRDKHNKKSYILLFVTIIIIGYLSYVGLIENLRQYKSLLHFILLAVSSFMGLYFYRTIKYVRNFFHNSK